jgi:aconitase B
LSQRFLNIMLALRDQQIPYVRFDRDGGFVEGCEPAPEFAGAG